MPRTLGLTLALLVTVLAGESAGQQTQVPTWPQVQGRGICLNRYVYGYTRAYRYYGYVSPFFNPHHTVPLERSSSRAPVIDSPRASWPCTSASSGRA
jgi:hypothetical protein